MSRGLLNTSRWRLIRVSGLFAAWVIACFFLTGCETLDSRLTRNQALLNDLSPAHQNIIRQGKVQVGFTPTEVYLAWGAPSHKTFTENTQGGVESWYYTTTQTETYYREERYFDREYGRWRFVDRPYQRYREDLFKEAVFTNGTLSSFTFYPFYQPFRN